MFYVSLFHGRENPEQEMEGQGSVGPIIGPVNVSWTYGTIKLHDPERWDEWAEMPTKDDVIAMPDGIFYGDFEVWSASDPLLETPVSKHRPRISFREFEAWSRRFRRGDSAAASDPLLDIPAQAKISYAGDAAFFEARTTRGFGLNDGTAVPAGAFCSVRPNKKDPMRPFIHLVWVNEKDENKAHSTQLDWTTILLVTNIRPDCLSGADAKTGFIDHIAKYLFSDSVPSMMNVPVEPDGTDYYGTPSVLRALKLI